MKTFATALALVSLCALTAILEDPAGSAERAQVVAREAAAPTLASVGGDGMCLDPWSGCTAAPTIATASR